MTTPQSPEQHPADMMREGFETLSSRSSIDYLLRNMHTHHVQLTQMADQKAQILIGIASLITTYLLGLLSMEGFDFGLFVLAVFMLTAAVLAIAAVAPGIRPNRDQAYSENPLYYGTFSRLSRIEYLRNMRDIMASDPQVHEALLLDIYNMGQVLYRKKYRLLGIAYRVFLGGLLLGGLIITLEWIV